jgi:hypothetical protein
MENNMSSRQQQMNDFFLLKPPKPLTPELVLKIVILLLLPIIPAIVLLSKLSDGISLYIGFLVLVYFTWLRPRMIKKKKYNSRVSSDTLNNWLLESLKTKILNRAIEYLELETTDHTTEQFIIVPYPVFHCTKKINDESILRVKSITSKSGKNVPEEYCYNYSVWNIQILVLSQNYLSYYFCSYNWLNDEILNEKTNEYFYQDIALVKTEFEQVSFLTKWDKNPISEARITKLIHSSGDVLSLIAELPELQQPAKTILDIEKIEKVLRLLIRHAKAKDESRKQVNINFRPAEMKSEAIEI